MLSTFTRVFVLSSAAILSLFGENPDSNAENTPEPLSAPVEITIQNMTKRPEARAMTTSVVIPCVPKHFQYIPHLLVCYSEQTVVPDEVVISLSEAWKTDRLAIADLRSHSWPFKLKLIQHQKKKSEGTNLNIAAAYSTGDIILGQSADDIPHPQRVEVIKYLFENYYIDHLMHTLTYPTECFSLYSIEDLQAYYFQKYVQEIEGRPLHNGVVCLTRETADKVRWVEGFREGTDTEFNKLIYAQIEYKAVLFNPLMLYRIELSTYTGINREEQPQAVPPCAAKSGGNFELMDRFP